MKNLILLNTIYRSSGVENATLLAYDNLNEVTYIATKSTVTGYCSSSKQVQSFISLSDESYLSKGDKITSLHYVFDQESICISTSSGDLLLWQPEVNNLECVGSVDAGFLSVEWSPDQELLVLTTGNGTFVLMTKDFDPVCEQEIHTGNFGEAAPVTVHWGKKETQFHGSEGKEAAKQQVITSATPVLSWDDRRTEISWRGDGQLFAISSVSQSSGCRHLKIYDRQGTLQATNQTIDGLENCICWRPSGNLIVSSQRKPNKHDVIFFEKNGLQHGEFTLPFAVKQKVIVKMSWNINSDILAIQLEDMISPTQHTVQLWTVSNYRWYLKQEMYFEVVDHQPCLLWDPEDASKLHILSQDGIYVQKTYMNGVVQSKGENNLSMVAVIDGAKLLSTPFKSMVVPPPMSTYQTTLPSAVNLVAFGIQLQQHDIFVQLSNKEFCLIKYSVERSYSVIGVGSSSLSHFSLRHLIWLQLDLLVAVADTQDGNSLVFLKIETRNDKVELILQSTLAVDRNIYVLFKNNENNNKLFFEDSNARIISVIEDGEIFALGEEVCSLPQLCCHVTSTQMERSDVVFGLTNHYRLFMNEKEIANNCTSFLLHDKFLLFTTHSHTLRSVYLKSLASVNQLDTDCSYCFNEAIRRIERGSKIVTAVQQGTSVVLQMPRGNLECIHPRALIVTYLQHLLDRLEYKKAMGCMRKNRINLNLMYDHNPKLFLDNVGKFVTDVNSISHINLFLADLMPEDVCSTLYYPFYHFGKKKVDLPVAKKSDTKVDTICSAVRRVIESHGDEKFLLCLLTTYAKQSKPDLESVLMKIKHLKEHPLQDKDGCTYEKALSYILYLVDVNQLFDIALGLYDFNMVLMVAEKSQKDPKEYLPFLNNFKNMELNYQRYSIDKYLKRHTKALIHLSKCEDRVNEFIEFVKEQRLYKEALKLFPRSSQQFNKISFEYGGYLFQQKLYEDSGIVFSRSGFHKDALDSFLCTTNWNMVLTEATFLCYSDNEMQKLCRNLSEKLKSHHLYDEASLLLELYVKDIEESVVCLLEGGLWFRALQLINKYNREDLIETNVKITMIEHYEHLTEKIEDLKTRFIKHNDRLKIVLETKEHESLEILEGIRDEPENDLYSDTSSITGVSVTSASSKGSRSSGHSRKSRNKVGRKKYSLREGGKHEDFALREVLAEIVNTADKMKEEISALLKVLVLYFYEDRAKNLQCLFVELLDAFETNMKEIWKSEDANASQVTTFGSEATVHTILAQRNANLQQAKRSGLPEPVKPTLRTNVHWKMHVLRT